MYWLLQWYYQKNVALVFLTIMYFIDDLSNDRFWSIDFYHKLALRTLYNSTIDARLLIWYSRGAAAV